MEYYDRLSVYNQIFPFSSSRYQYDLILYDSDGDPIYLWIRWLLKDVKHWNLIFNGKKFSDTFFFTARLHWYLLRTISQCEILILNYLVYNSPERGVYLTEYEHTLCCWSSISKSPRPQIYSSLIHGAHVSIYFSPL